MFSSIKSQSWYKRSFYVQLSSSFSTCTFQSITAFNPLMWCNETDRQTDSLTDTRMFPDHVLFVSKMFLTPTSIKNLPITTLTQIIAWNIAEAAIIITQIGNKFGVIKPRMWIIWHGSNSQQLQILVATTHVHRTAWQNVQRCKKQKTRQRAICYINGDSDQWW